MCHAAQRWKLFIRAFERADLGNTGNARGNRTAIPPRRLRYNTSLETDRFWDTAGQTYFGLS